MTTRDLEGFFKRANKIITNYEDKISTLDYEYFIISSIIFTSDKDYYYLFNVFKDNKIIEQIAVNDNKSYSKTFKDLSIKYKANVIYNYSDLSYKQLNFLDTAEDKNIKKEELANLLFKKQFDLL